MTLRMRQLSEEQETLIDQIRKVPGFEDFLRPSKLSGLLRAFQHIDGPVIFIHVYHSSCNALALYRDGSIVHIPLPHLTAKRAHKLRSLWVLSLRTCHVRVRRAVVTPEIITPGGTSMFGRILTRLWSWVVEPVLSRLNLVRTFY